MSRLWGPGGDKGPLAAHSPPWGQTAGITGWTAPVTGGQRWAAAQALAPPPPRSLQTTRPYTSLSREAMREARSLAPPDLCPGWGCRQGQSRQVGVVPTSFCHPPFHTSPSGRTH